MVFFILALLLRRKWIDRLCDELSGLPEMVLNTLTAKIQALAAKYSETLSAVDKEIERTERELGEMLGQLTGSEFDMAGRGVTKAVRGVSPEQ